MNREQMIARQQAITQRQLALLDEAKAGGGSLNADQKAEYDRLDAEFLDLSAKIAAIDENETRRLALAARQQATPTRQTQGNPAPAPRQAAADWRTPREFLTAVMRATGRNAVVDPRLSADRFATAGSDEQSTFSDSHGGYLIPETVLTRMLSTGPDGDPMGAYVTSIPMATPTVKIPARTDRSHSTSLSGGFRVYRRNESQDVESSRMQMEMVKLEAESMMGIAYATEELMTDSPVSFAALIEAGFNTEFAGKMVKERLNGTGVGEFLGVMNSPCLVSIAKETGQAAATLLYENLIKMRARIWGYGSAIWLANHDILPQLMQLNQLVGTGGVPAWQPSARDGAPDTLFGRPLMLTEFCATTGTTGDIICGNWSQYLEGTLESVTGAQSIHVRFLENERAFRFTTRNAGAPWWRSALTPINGSTLSPFVALDTRS